ncbi:uncharacterized protein [Aegilops tauschii subsp. strangulata]|uniref:uncharacterized protein n=1 Tax=Aegilops tauschii subsp. strangulata TaxID=200361 RepID=UPI001ABC5F9E|nr:uncharacterized protein LOC120964361 [Aegilops tauschii subsp. strangulata]XP_044445206.1 uncharacterized protein LOC123172269 [Triticum aestivum]
MQQPALLATGGLDEYEYARLETLLMEGGSASAGAPRFNGTDYESWRFSMRLHLGAFHYRVWSIVETGLSSCVDEANPTAPELRNIHYNAQAMNAIYCALSDDQLYRIWHLDIAKEVWEALRVIHQDTPIIRELKVKQLREKMKFFAWRKNEHPISMYSRLMNLASEMKLHGCQEVTDSYVVRKILHAITPRSSTFVTIIRQRPNFEELTPLDVLHNFQVHDNMQELSRRGMRGYARAKVDTVTPSKPAREAGCSGEAPHFDGTHSLSWQRRMKFHLFSMHPLVWRAVETGFSCADEANEESNVHHSAGAICAFYRAMDDSPYNWISPYKSAKEIWDDLRKFSEAGSKSMLSSLRQIWTGSS